MAGFAASAGMELFHVGKFGISIISKGWIKDPTLFDGCTHLSPGPGGKWRDLSLALAHICGHLVTVASE
jgi:hypothetical protein